MSVPSLRTVVTVMVVVLVVFASVPPTTIPAAPSPQPPAGPGAADATTRWGTKHLFEVGYVSAPTPVPLLQLHSWTVTIRDAAGKPVDGATVTVSGGMPAHGHGLPTVPQVKSLGAGRYLVEGLKFHMPGAWAVGFRIRAGTLIDAVTFELHLG
jgi:hypothetical protein